MHCVTCDRNLKDHELVRRHAITDEFLDMCDTCLREVPGLPTKMPAGVFHVSDPFEDNQEDTEGIVTDCYNLDVDKE